MELIIYEKSYLILSSDRREDIRDRSLSCNMSIQGRNIRICNCLGGGLLCGWRKELSLCRKKFKRNLLYEELPITSCNIKEITLRRNIDL